MKQNFLLCLCLISLIASAQQNLPSNVLKSNGFIKSYNLYDVKDSGMRNDQIDTSFRHFTFYGIGNISSETLEKFNGGGKVAFLFKTGKRTGLMPKSYFVSFNKNATNGDSLLPSTLVFPEVGNHSFLVTAFWNLPHRRSDISGNNMEKERAFFFEFAMKTIKINLEEPTSKEKEEKFFNTLHYTAGYKYCYNLRRKIDDKDYDCSFGANLFLSYTNIPNEDEEDFGSIVKQPVTTSGFLTGGVKFSLGINGFQIFADLRHTLTKESKLPLKELKGFNSNIGVTFSSEIFSL